MANLHFGKQVRTARENLGVSRDDFAREVGTSTSTIARLELAGAEPKLHVVLAIANILGMTLDDLLVGDAKQASA
jgi:transcriptional regulator with XRE-family HTH domain